VTERPEFPEYGSAGDKIGARRLRRSFRLCVAACVFFVAVLWISEQYLRFDLPESQFIMALTHEPESARPILRSAVKRDSEKREYPTPKYLAALAVREEDDKILPTFEEAYKLDPDNSFLAIRFGCELFRKERYAEARERFREATVQPPKNALPGYLEAAALHWAQGAPGDLSESLALVAKTNSGSDPATYPRPFWAAPLPEGGIWHQRLQRQIVDDCCAPLYKYMQAVVSEAGQEIALQNTQNWDRWLETLQKMGERIASTGGPGTLQAIAGIRIQEEALKKRIEIRELDSAGARNELVDHLADLKAGLALLNEFEDKRDIRIEAQRARVLAPLRLSWLTFAALAACYLLAYIAAHIVRAKRVSWSLSHASWAKAGFLLGNCILLMLLWQMTYAARGSIDAVSAAAMPGGQLFEPVAGVWWATVAALVLLCIVYPAIRLPRVSAVLSRHEIPSGDAAAIRAARHARRTAYVSFARRSFGVTMGLYLYAIVIWVVGHRLLFALYPWQPKLLVDGLAGQETALVREVVSLIGMTGGS
jgi:hypothetical protein